MNYYLDTDICIFALKGTFLTIAQWIQSYSPDRLKISAIVKAELLLGGQRSDQSKRVLQMVERFLDPFEIVAFDDRCAHVYATVRLTLEHEGRAIGPHDLLIASTVLAHQGKFRSCNYTYMLTYT